MPADQQADDLTIVCQRCGKVEDIGPEWEASGDVDELGRMMGVCPGCTMREEEQETFDAFAEDYMFEGGDDA